MTGLSVKFRLLGPLEVEIGSIRPLLGGSQQRGLLAMLLTSAGRVVSYSDLIDELWPTGRAVRVNTVHAQVSRLRDTFTVEGSPLLKICSRPGGYMIESPGWLDVQQFRFLRHRAALVAGQEPQLAMQMLREALELWRGDALQDSVLGRRCRAAAAGLDEARLQAHEELARLTVAHADPAVAVADLRVLACMHPLRESLLALQMAALHSCGRRAEALQVFQEARGRFTAELGAEPGELMQRQHLRILKGAVR